MGRAPSHKKARKHRPKEKIIICNKQFPDCPEEPNEKDCKTCPFFKKKVRD